MESLYTEYNRYIYHLCLKLTRNKEEAEDLMQDVWLKVVRSSDKSGSIEHAKAWLTTVCMNTFRDRYRKNVRRNQHIMPQPEGLDVSLLDLIASDEAGAEEITERQDAAVLMHRKIAELDGIYRSTILYFYVHQLSLIEIADEMKVSVGTVKSRLFRAKQRLKESILADSRTRDYILTA